MAAKTVIISRNAYGWQFGGAEKFTFNLAAELKQNDFRPIVVTRVPELIKLCKKSGIKTFKNLWLKNENRRRYSPLYYLLYPVMVAQWKYLILRYRASAIICGSRDDQTFGTLAAKILGKPSIWIDHADMKDILGQPMHLMKSSYRWALRAATKIVAVSQAERDKIFVNIPAEFKSKFVVINNGAVRGMGEVMAKPAGKKIVSFIGRIEKDKGVFELVDAAAAVMKKLPKVEFWLAGKGRVVNAIKPNERLKLLGHLDNIWPLLLASDLFVYPTHHDASPLAPVEALLAGVPVIATNVGGLPEIITDDSGILVPRQDAPALAKAIENYFGDSKLQTKLKAGAKKRGDELEFGRVVKEKYLPLIEEVTK